MKDEILTNSNVTLDDIKKILDNSHSVLEEILMWLKISGSEKVRMLLESTLNTPEKRLIYYVSDGKTTREISNLCDVGTGTVSRYWSKWYGIGLMKKIAVQGGGERHFKSFDLLEYGIEPPKLKTKNLTTKVNEDTNEKEEIE